MFIRGIKSLFCFVILFSVVFTYFSMGNYSVSASAYADFASVSDVDVDYGQMIDEYRTYYNNDDVVGKISIDNSDFDNIIVQGNDNSYYLSHNNYGNYSIGGSIFVDSRVNIVTDKKVLIFGHNNSKGNGVFSILEEYYNYDYYKGHEYITLTTDGGLRYYRIFSVYVETEDWSYMQVVFDNDNDYFNSVNMLKNKSIYDTSIDVSKDDNILILQTCSYNKDYREYKNKYLLIIAKEVDVSV